MLLFFLVLGLIFVISGGIGLFYVNTGAHVVVGSAVFFLGNLFSATFIVFGFAILVFVALFNGEFD